MSMIVLQSGDNGLTRCPALLFPLALPKKRALTHHRLSGTHCWISRLLAGSRAKLASFRHWAEYLAFRALGAFIGALPVETASRWSARGWRLVAPRLSRHRRALSHIAMAFPEKSFEEQEAIALGMWENLGRVFAESFHLGTIAREGRVTFAEGSEPDAILPADRRFITSAPHLGNWEAAIIGVGLAGAKGVGVYQKIKNPLVDQYVRRLREALYPGGLLQKNSGAARQVLTQVKAGHAFATMGDLRDHQGIVVPFFGRPAPSLSFPALAARSLGVPLIAGAVLREPQGTDHVRFRIMLRQIPVPKTGDRDADVLEATAALQAAFEDFIRQKPDQWMWAHRRWG
jgi:KDO2-lipid IV(A) lauroyltransferase